MPEEFQVVYVEKPESAVWEAVGGGVHHYNIQQVGEDRGQGLCFILRGPDQTIVGGVIGETHWDWFCLSLLWVKEELRGRGHGHRLLTLAEEEARKRGAKNAYLDTFSFQAPDFYKRHGYQVFGELSDFPAGHRRFYLQRQL